MEIVDVNGNPRVCFNAYPDKNYPGYMKIEYKTQVRSYSDWYPIKEFIKNNPRLKHLAASASPVVSDDLGVVSKSNKQGFTDKTKNWKINAYSNFPVWISRGKGEGQTRVVTKNSKNTITIDKPWDNLPDETSQYVISYNIHDPQVLQNTLPGKVNDTAPENKP